MGSLCHYCCCLLLYLDILLAAATTAMPGLPATPSSGVRIFLPYENATLPNFAVIHAGQFDDEDRIPPDGILDPLWCQSANPADGIGVWYRAGDNRTLPTTPQDPLYVQYYPGQVGIYRTTGISGFEGIYQCEMPDENWVNHTLYVGVYKTGTYLDFSGPMVGPSMQFSLVSPRDADPPVFTLSFNSTQGPPTAVNCTVDGDPVVVAVADLSRLVHKFTFPSVVEVAVTFRERRGGVYKCIVTLMGVNEESQFFTIGTSYSTLEMQVAETPAEVMARRAGISTILVSWATPSSALVVGYEVWANVSNGTQHTTLPQVTTTQTSLTLANVSPTLNYTFYVVAFDNGGNNFSSGSDSGVVLPSLRSATTEIQFPGKK